MISQLSLTNNGLEWMNHIISNLKYMNKDLADEFHDFWNQKSNSYQSNINLNIKFSKFFKIYKWKTLCGNAIIIFINTLLYFLLSLKPYLAPHKYTPSGFLLVLVARPLVVLAARDQQALMRSHLTLAQEAGLNFAVDFLNVKVT